MMPPPEPTSPQLQGPSPAALLPAFTVNCVDGQPCPPFVGMLTSPREGYYERCSGTLIGPRLFLTAGHCVSLERRRAGASCHGHRVHFPGTSLLPASSHACAQVIEAESPPDGNVVTNDYALLELDTPVERTVAEVDAQLPRPGTAVQVSGITAVDGSTLSHRLITQSCQVTDPGRAIAALGPAAARMGWLEDCYIHPGHSGGPVQGPQGRVRAFVLAGGDPFFALGVMNPLPPNQASEAGPVPDPSSPPSPEPNASTNPR